MIIFQATPSRLFPPVLQSILSQINMTYNDFHYPYLVKKYENWLNVNNILTGIPKECKHIRTDGFLYGVFSSCHLNLEKDDFIFTLLNHPIDQVYECFTYLKFTQDQSGPRAQESLEKNPKERYLAEIEVFKTLEDATLERFVDLVLEDFDFSFEYKDIEYLPIRENIYGFSDFSHFSHVGKYSELDKTFEKLSEAIGYEMKPPIFDKSLSFQGDFYRKDDLIKKFKNQIDFYEKI